MARRKGLGPLEVRDEDGELVMTLDQAQVEQIMADIFTLFRPYLDNHAEFENYLRDHPRPDEQADDPTDPALD